MMYGLFSDRKYPTLTCKLITSIDVYDNWFRAFVPVLPFCLYEGTNPEAYIEPLSLNLSDELHNIISPLKVILMQLYSGNMYWT